MAAVPMQRVVLLAMCAELVVSYYLGPYVYYLINGK